MKPIILNVLPASLQKSLETALKKVPAGQQIDLYNIVPDPRSAGKLIVTIIYSPREPKQFA